MNAEDTFPNDADGSDNITFVMYLPDKGWITFICIPRVKLGQICLAPVKWLRYIGSYAYGADGDIFSQLCTDANEDEDEIMAHVPIDEKELTDVGSDKAEEEPVVDENHGEAEPASKVPVDKATVLSENTTLEELPAVCYFWSEYSPRIIDLKMISDRETTKASSDSASSTRNTQLPGQVKARDGNTSIFHAGLYVSGHLLQACHLIPQSKGDEYVKRLEQFHGVPPEERMNTVESARNMVSMKAAWHTYVAKSVAAILVVPNRFLSKDDIAFTSQPRFAQDGNSYSEPSPENPSPTTSSLSSGKDSKEYKPELLLSETDIPLRPQSERIQQDAEKSVTADRQKKAAEEAAVKAAEEAIAHLVSARGYPEFLTPTEPPFNDQSQLVMQYLDTEGEFRVGLDDQWAVPHNTAARLREGTRLSVLALHTAYICAVWNAFSPDTENSVLAPDIPRFGHLTSFKLRAAPAFDSHTATLSSTSRQEQRREGWAWDLMLGWRIPSVVARQEAEMRRARDVEREANEAKVRQWSRTVEQ